MILRTPNWEDFVDLSFSEIRSCGSNNLQVVRRLRAMIGDLIKTLPGHRHPALLEQLSLLDREIERHFSYPEELALARVADTQGLGGSSGTRGRRSRVQSGSELLGASQANAGREPIANRRAAPAAPGGANRASLTQINGRGRRPT